MEKAMRDFITPTDTLMKRLDELRAAGVTKIKRCDLQDMVAREKWKDFRIDRRGSRPYSETLEEALANLLHCNIVWTHWVYGEGDWVVLTKWEDI